MKKQMIRFILPCLILAMTCSGILALPAMDTPPQEVIDAAQKGMSDFLANPAIIGSKKSPISRISESSHLPMALGNGFQIFTIAPAVADSTASLDSLAVPTGHWRFLVLNANQPVVMMTVAKTGGVWQAVSIGGAGIADELFQVMNRWPSAEGYNYRFIRIFQARSDFIEISRNGQVAGFVPLTSSRISFKITGDFDPATVMRDSEIFPQLNDILSKHSQEPTLPGQK